MNIFMCKSEHPARWRPPRPLGWITTILEKEGGSELFVQDNTKKGTMHLQSTVVFDEAELPELVHEVVYPRARGANHFRQRLLPHPGDHFLGPAFFSEARQNQERACQPLFARIEKLIDQVRLRVGVALNDVRHEHIGEPVFLMERAQHFLFLNLQDGTVRNCSRGCHSHRLIRGDASLAQKIARAKKSDCRFFSLLG